MNFSYGVIAIVGVLVAISLGFIATSPDDIIEPRVVSVDETLPGCTKQWDPMCGVDGETYGNACTLDAADIELDYAGECMDDSKPVACTLQWDPMCGVDGETYGNSCALDAADIELDYEGECMVDELIIDEPIVEETSEPIIEETVIVSETVTSEPTVEESTTVSETVVSESSVEEVMEPESIPVEFNGVISLPEGSGAPGCDETNECYIPFNVSVLVGDEVTWSNDDSAAHTVTSGTPEYGPDGNFDSGLFMAGGTFSATFDESGEYPYFCMVHPWMIGSVTVN